MYNYHLSNCCKGFDERMNFAGLENFEGSIRPILAVFVWAVVLPSVDRKR